MATIEVEKTVTLKLSEEEAIFLRTILSDVALLQLQKHVKDKHVDDVFNFAKTISKALKQENFSIL